MTVEHCTVGGSMNVRANSLSLNAVCATMTYKTLGRLGNFSETQLSNLQNEDNSIILLNE